jgi:hypothetical protein
MARAKVEVWLVFILMAAAFGAGVAARDTRQPAAPASSTWPSVGGVEQAPPLNEDQIRLGELPAGHPPVGGASEETPSPSPTTSAR